MIKTEFSEDLNKLLIKIEMPAFLTKAFSLLKHTFPDGGETLVGTEREVATNLRVTNYNKLLDSIGFKRGGSPLWYKSVVDLPEAACSKKLNRKYLKDIKSGCMVLMVDYLIEASTFDDEDDEFELL